MVPFLLAATRTLRRSGPPLKPSPSSSTRPSMTTCCATPPSCSTSPSTGGPTISLTTSTKYRLLRPSTGRPASLGPFLLWVLVIRSSVSVCPSLSLPKSASASESACPPTSPNVSRRPSLLCSGSASTPRSLNSSLAPLTPAQATASRTIFVTPSRATLLLAGRVFAAGLTTAGVFPLPQGAMSYGVTASIFTPMIRYFQSSAKTPFCAPCASGTTSRPISASGWQ